MCNLKKVGQAIDDSIPGTSMIIIIVGIVILICGVILVYFPSQTPISQGVSIFALGLALVSFGLTQFKSTRNGNQLKRIEEKLDQLLKK